MISRCSEHFCWIIIVLILSVIGLVGIGLPTLAQFAPRHNASGTTAIHRDSNIIKTWALRCEVKRGYLDIAHKSLGLASYGQDSAGKGNNPDILSLGDSGVATLMFRRPIINGPGPDFVVFENGFGTAGGDYLELAFVEVSSDGINFQRFPSYCGLDQSIQIGPYSTTIGVERLNNFAGKYVAPYGTPFDLADLEVLAQRNVDLNLNHITHVRLVDAIGSINPVYGIRAANGNLVNDPYPTAFPSGGFDLDAIGVIHEQAINTNECTTYIDIVDQHPSDLGHPIRLMVKTEDGPIRYGLFDYSGRIVGQGTLINGSNSVVSPSFSGVHWLIVDKSGCKMSVLKLLWY